MSTTVLFCRGAILRALLVIALPLLVATALLQSARAQSGDFPPALAARLDSTLSALQVYRNATGVSAAIISPRYGTWTGAAGIADIRTGERVTPDMLFGIGSISKTYTSAVVLGLVADGALSLSDTIGRWISGVANIDGGVTVRQLLAHTSGIDNYTDHAEFWQTINLDLDHYMTPEEVLTYVGPRKFVRGTSWSYSNTNYVLLGMIVERITGQPFETVLEQRILVPQRLHETAMGSLDTLPGPVSGNHIDTDGDGDLDNLAAYPRRAIYSGAWTAGGLYASAENVVRWGHELYGGRVLSKEMMDSLLTFRSVPEFGSGGAYGLGVIKVNAAGKVAVGHTGGIPGFATALWHIAADDVTVAVLVNDDSPAATIMAVALLNVLSQAAGIDGDARTIALAPAHPNPFDHATTISFEAAPRSHATVRVYDALGRSVRTLLDGVVDGGRQMVTWDGGDDAGASVTRGAYVVRVEVDGRAGASEVVVRR
jgi:D-alanyl-D-alanine carboxypeptidase